MNTHKKCLGDLDFVFFPLFFYELYDIILNTIRLKETPPKKKKKNKIKKTAGFSQNENRWKIMDALFGKTLYNCMQW